MYLAKVPPAQKLSSSGWAKTPRMRFECCIASILFISDLSFLFSFKHVGCYDRTKGDRATSIPGAAQFGKRGFPCEQAPDTRGVAEDFRERERDEGAACVNCRRERSPCSSPISKAPPACCSR